MNILLRMAFVGTGYHGFQVQANAVTVCRVLQDAMEAVFGARPDVKGCSRTDAGVHARDYALSFRQETAIPMDKLPLALNSRLPADIRVLSARVVPQDFHARYSAAGKEYRYVILNAAVDDPFTQGMYYRVTGPLDAAAMDAAARHFVGRHDFAAFCSSGGSVTDTVRTLRRATAQRQGPWVTFTVAGDGFLYNMVRILAGTLVAVGRGALAPADMPAILAGRDRAAAGDTLPACGLFLNRVFYASAVLGDGPGAGRALQGEDAGRGGEQHG